VSAASKVSIDGGPYALAAGPDGAMWATLAHGGSIARVTTGGDVTVYSVGPQSRPSIITAGPDGAMWFTRTGDDRVGRITTAGELTAFQLEEGSGPFGITAGADGALWFTAMTSGDIGRIPMDGPIQEMELPGKPHAVVADPNDGVWVSLWGPNQIARVSGDSSEVVTIDLPSGSEPHGLAIGSDGALWVALASGFVLRMPT
jgi:virginiamycin B lyase